MRPSILAALALSTLLHHPPLGAAETEARARAQGSFTAIDDAPPVAESPRLTISGMLGAGRAAAPGSAAMPGADPSGGALLAGTLFGGDGAVGLDVPHTWGATRIECEARGRTTAGRADPAGGTHATWSAMGNVWHDFDIGDRLAVYAGGGVGPGGSRQTDPLGGRRSTGVAWQVGTGVAFDVTERMTLDLGYRFGGQEPLTRSAPGLPPSGEMVLAVRLHDPLRGWLDRERSSTRGPGRR